MKIERRFIMKTNYTIQNFAKRLVMVIAVGLMAVNVWGTVTKTYVFTTKTWNAISDGPANWTSTTDGTAFENDGIKATTTYNNACGTSPMEFRNISQIVVIYNTNKSSGAGNIKIQVGTNTEKSNSVEYSKCNDGRVEYFETTFDFSPTQSGSVKMTINTTTNSLYVVAIRITYDPLAYKVTYDPESGSCDEDDATEVSGGAGVTLPTATPNAAGWEFAGWAKSACSETEVAPRLYMGGTTYYPDAAETLHAVYRKMTDGSSTTTATFTASNESGLTIIGKSPYTNMSWKHTSSGVEFEIADYGRYYASSAWFFNLDNRYNNGYAVLSAFRRIKQVVFTATSNSYLIDDVTAWDDGDASLSTSSTTQTVTGSGNVTQLLISTASGSTSETRITTFTVTYYDTKFNSNPCGNNVTLSKGTQTNATISSFSLDAVATCSAIDADRQVTVTVAAATGYEFLSTARLTFAKTSGTASATYVSGPTGTGPYTWVYRFTKDDSGAGTFSVTSATPKSYTVTLNDNSGSGGDGTKTVTYYANTNMTSAVTIPTKTHYIFGGYWTSANSGATLDTKVIDADGSWVASVSGYTDATPNWIFAGNVTLYAKWTEHTYVNYRTNCCTKPTFTISGTGKSETAGKISFTVLREDLGGVPSSTWAELEIAISSNSSGAITIIEGTGGDAGKTAWKLSSWESRNTDGGTIATTDHATFTNPSAGNYLFKVKTTASGGYTGQGTYRIGIQQAANGDYCAATVYLWVDVTLRDKFVDQLNGNGTVNLDGHGAQLAAPSLSDLDTQVENACHSEGRKLKGWIKETDLKAKYETGNSERVQTIDGLCETCDNATPWTSLVVAPGENVTTSGATWYAVWAYEK